MNEWQLIETAPKDEEQTILVLEDGYVVPVMWGFDGTWRGVWGAEKYIQDGTIYDVPLIAYKPTHWMSLPEPPK